MKQYMNKNLITAGLMLGAGLFAAQQVSAFELDFGVVGNSQMQFNAKDNPTAGPATLKFNPSTQNNATKTFDFQVNATVGGAGNAVGDYGTLGGTYAIAPIITTVGNIHYYVATTGTATTTVLAGSSGRIAFQDFTETGVVTGMGTFTLHDGTGHNLTGTATLSKITDTYEVTYNNNSGNTVHSTSFISNGLTGTGATTGTGVTLNLTGITYGGTQSDLVSLATGDLGPDGKGRAELDLTWSFNGRTLTSQTQSGGGVHRVSYSGHVVSDAHTLPDGGMTLALLGAALSGAAVFKRRLVG